MSHHSHWRAPAVSVEAYTPGCITPKPPTWAVASHHAPLHKLLEHPKMRRRDVTRTEPCSKETEEHVTSAFSFTVRQFRRSQRASHSDKDHATVQMVDSNPHDDDGSWAQVRQASSRVASMATPVHVPTADEVLDADADGSLPVHRDGGRIHAGQAMRSVLSKTLSTARSTLGNSVRLHNPRGNAAAESDSTVTPGHAPELRHHTKHHAERVYRADLLPQPSLLESAVEQQRTQNARVAEHTCATPSSPRPPFYSSVKGGDRFAVVSDADRHAHDALLDGLALDDLCVHRKVQEETALARRAAISARRCVSARLATAQRRPNFAIAPSASVNERSTQVGVQLAVTNATKLASRLDAAAFPVDKRLARTAEVASTLVVGHVTVNDTAEKSRLEALEHPVFTLARSRTYGSNKYHSAPARAMAYQADEDMDGLALIAEFERTNRCNSL